MKNKLTTTVIALLISLSSQAGGGFSLWQLASQADKIGNSYVMRTDKGRVVVIDGGYAEEAPYLHGFIAALGGKVDMWIITHPHPDHSGALTEILKKPGSIEIKSILQSRFPESLRKLERSQKHASRLYSLIDSSGIKEINLDRPGLTIKIDGMHLKVLGVTNPEITANPYNNSSMVLRVWDKRKSVLFLGDLGIEGGEKLLSSAAARELDCDYLQMAHHGQAGVSREFYRTVKFRACLWPTPTWVWNNDAGKGFDTHILKTIETRRWMDELGIEEQYVSCLLGTSKIF